MVATLFQHCNAVLRWKSLLRMVSCNVALKRRRRGRDNRELKQRRGRRQQERQKSNWFRLVKQQLCTCITLFLHISLPSLHDHNVEVPNFTFWRGRENKTTTFSFFSWTLQYFTIWLQKICQHLRNWTSWKKRDNVRSSANSLFKWRFRSRRRSCCWSSLMNLKIFIYGGQQF